MQGRRERAYEYIRARLRTRQRADLQPPDARRRPPVGTLGYKLAGLAAITAVVGGWLLYVHAWRDTRARSFAYRDLTSQLHVQPNASFVRRFREREQLDDYVRRSGTLPAPRIDFDREEAVLVSAGPRSSTGYEVRVVRAVRERGRIVLTVRERTPSLADPGRPRVTYPYRLIVFRRTDVPVYVRWLGAASDGGQAAVARPKNRGRHRRPLGRP